MIVFIKFWVGWVDFSWFWLALVSVVRFGWLVLGFVVFTGVVSCYQCGWCWLVLVGVGWCWLVLVGVVGFGWFWFL